MASSDILIKQGKTFTRVFYWENKTPLVFKAITAVTKSAPVQITSTGHDLVDNWRTAITGVRGMSQINSVKYPPRPSDFHPVTVVDANTIKIPSIDSSLYKTYTSGGFLVYYQPVDLTGYTARMKIKDRIGGTELASLTTETGEIVVDNAAKTITVTIAAADTEAFTFMRGVYDLELVNASNAVTELAAGSVLVRKEVTTS